MHKLDWIRATLALATLAAAGLAASWLVLDPPTAGAAPAACKGDPHKCPPAPSLTVTVTTTATTTVTVTAPAPPTVTVTTAGPATHTTVTRTKTRTKIVRRWCIRSDYGWWRCTAKRPPTKHVRR